ncbi:MAG TPA: hypothetical protein VIO62_00685 [Candidatus Dormibacteraeota bacterium]
MTDWAGGYDYEFVTAAGWDMYLYTLDQYLTHFIGRAAVYIGAEAPPESARQEAWPRLTQDLGLADPISSGSQVRIELAGVGPLEGVVDYVSPNFLGLRTADSLIRLYGRAVIGMTVAVGQHAFAQQVDADKIAVAWQTWLLTAFEPQHARYSWRWAPIEET